MILGGNLTSVRSPAALGASLVCLTSAMVLAGLLIQDDDAPTAVHDAAEGEALHVEGELEPWHGAEGWEEIKAMLSGTTYELHVAGTEDLVLLTGMEPGWEQKRVAADAVVVLHVPHPERNLSVIVLAVDVDSAVFG